jgi:hypothetical protein
MANSQRLATPCTNENRPTSYLPQRMALAAMIAGTSGTEVQVKPCYSTPRSSQKCVMCGMKAKHMHMPLGRVGHFCATCCPTCAGGS